MKFVSVAIIGAGLVLSGCGATEVAQVYAQPGDVVQGGSKFAEQDVKRFVVVNGTTSLKDQTIEVSLSDDRNTIYVRQNYKDFVLTWVPSAADPDIGHIMAKIPFTLTQRYCRML